MPRGFHSKETLEQGLVRPDTYSPRSPEELVEWITRALGIKTHKGPRRHHAGILRLSRWVEKPLAHQPEAQIKPTELLQLAKQWLPEYFQKAKVSPDVLADANTQRQRRARHLRAGLPRAGYAVNQRSSNLRKSRTLFCPPKPKDSEMAIWMPCFRFRLGT